MLDAPEGHDALSFRSAATERLQLFVGRVHVRVVGELAATGTTAGGGFRAAVCGGLHDFKASMTVGRMGDMKSSWAGTSKRTRWASTRLLLAISSLLM